MKKALSILVLATVVLNVVSFYGCAKGEDDPFFSIHTRKARIVGDWDISSYKSEISTVHDNGEKSIEDFTLTLNKVKEIIKSENTVHDTSVTTSGNVNEAYYKFDKDGSVELILDYTLVKDSSGTNDNTGYTTTSKRTRIYKTRALGTWNFMSGIDDYKNKERISLVWETYNTSLNSILLRYVDDDDDNRIYTVNVPGIVLSENKYANGERAEVWEIDQLKNKETIIYQDVNFLDVSKTDTAGTTISHKGYRTMTLTQN